MTPSINPRTSSVKPPGYFSVFAVKLLSVKEAPSVKGLSEQQETKTTLLDVEPSAGLYNQGTDVTANQSPRDGNQGTADTYTSIK